MLSSALIGCFTVRLNVELCSDWLFHSAAHFSSSQEGNTGKIYISILSRAVISSGNYTVNKMLGILGQSQTSRFSSKIS